MVQEGAHSHLIALMLERLADCQDALQQERDAWTFVWSGPEPLHSKTADTFATVDQLVREAKSSLLIATYNIGLSASFRDLLESIAMRLESKMLNRLDLFFHPIQISSHLGTEPLQAIRQWFSKEVWPWPSKPHAYVDQRLLSGRGDFCYQHAKVVVADSETEYARALVTSANFSETAQRHNFEAGWLVQDHWRVRQVSDHFNQLVAQGLFLKL